VLHEFKAQITETSDGGFTARLVPFGEKVPYGKGTVEFAAGAITFPQSTPLTVDHSDGVLDRIGVMGRHFETDTGLFGEFSFADTSKAQEVRELLTMGAVTDVSVGVELADDFNGGVMEGALDHVSVVTHGRFGKTENPSKVLSVHDVKEPTVAETTEEATAPVVETLVEKFDDTPIMSAIAEMNDRIDGFEPDAPVAEFSGMEVFGALVEKRYAGKISNHALADVIGDLGTADASGLSPDWYWANGLQQNADRRRPLFAMGGSAPFPDYGNNLTTAKVTQEVTVGEHATQKSAVSSQALQAALQTYPIVWFAGAVDIALELIAQSNPSILNVVTNSLLRAYAGSVEFDANAKLVAGSTATGAVLDTSTYAALAGDIITTSDLIEDATGLPGDRLGVSPAQWIEILSLFDGGDRRQFAVSGQSNSDGAAGLTARAINIAGVDVFRSPRIVSALQFNTESFKKAERSPMDVMALNVEKMGQDKGILGATAIVHWDEGVYKYSV